MAVYLILIAAGILTRLLPHAWNFAPVTALAIFAAVYLPTRQAIVITLVMRFISDLVIGFFAWPLMIAVYAAHLVGVVLGVWIRRRKNIWRVIGAPVISAVAFFLITNFAFFYPTYSHDWSGVLAAYVNGLPFFRGTLFGDVIYTVLLVGGCEVWYKYHARAKLSATSKLTHLNAGRGKIEVR